MERFTKRLENGQSVMDCLSCELREHNCTALSCRNRLKDRVATYEDTGLTPEEIMRRKEAEDEGRIVVLPVKTDDLMDLLQKSAVHAVYEVVLKTGGSKEIFISAKEGIEQRFKNFDTIRMKAESELTGRDV